MQFLKAKRLTLILLAILLTLVACDYQPPVFVTATPDGLPIETVEPSAVPSLTVTPRPTNTIVSTAHPPPPTQIRPTATDEPTPAPETVERWKIGYNINGQEVPNRDYLLSDIRATCTRVQLVMDNLPLADAIYNILAECLPDGVEPIVIYRDYSPQEGGECTLTTASQMVNRWIAQGYKHIIRYSVNEPVYSEATWGNCLRREIQLMQLARMHGFTVAMTNFAVGTVQPQWVESGLFDDYLRALNQYGHYLAVHEYTSAALPFGVGLWSRECLLDPACVQPQNWATPEDLPLTRWAFPAQTDDSFGFEMLNRAYQRSGYTAQSVNGSLPPYWHILRFVWFWIRQDEIGTARTPVLITEAPWDHLNDIEDVLTPLEEDWAMERYLWDLRGVNSYERLWTQFYYPQWTHEEAALCQLIWLNRIYPDGVLGVTMFTWSSNPMWSNFDFSGRQGNYLIRLHVLIQRQANGEDLWNSICLRAA